MGLRGNSEQFLCAGVAHGMKAIKAVAGTENESVVVGNKVACAVCKELGLKCVEAEPFTPVTEEKQKENLELMKDADIILVADVPFGVSNLMNLQGLETMPGRIFFHKNALSSDYTGGKLVPVLEKIGKVKKITYFGDHDEFLRILKEQEIEQSKQR